MESWSGLYAHAAMGRLEHAIKALRRALELEPDSVGVRYKLGVELAHTGDLDDAIKDFSEAIRLKPGWAEAYANRAVAHAERGDAAESDQDAARARSLGVDAARLTEMLNDADRASD